MTQHEQVGEAWSSRLAFFFASVGSAVGLGNLWRFPNLCHTYGGAAFLLPYILGLIFIGVPILTIEFALGQVKGSGDVKCFSDMNKRLTGIGVGSVICGFMVTCYYVIILSWAAVYFIHSFQRADCDGEPCFVWTKKGAGDFLMGEVIGLGNMTIWEEGVPAANQWLNRSTKFVPGTFWALLFMWVAIFFCIFKGPRLTGLITYATMGIPLLLLIVFAILFGSMPGGNEGVKEYFTFNIEKLAGEAPCGGGPCRDAWSKAVAQVFFSLSITFGVMTAYSAANNKEQSIWVNALVVSFSDFLVAILAGFTVFTAVGVYANQSGQDLSEVASGGAGFALVFITFPAAIESLGDHGVSFAGRQVLAILWFGMIVLLGIDSAFSLVEGFVKSFTQARLFAGWDRVTMVFVVCVVGYLIGLEYATDTGLYALDSVDYYINVSMLFVGFMECTACGWAFGYVATVEQIGKSAYWITLGSMVVACYYGPRAGLGYGGAAGTAIGLVVGFFIFGCGLFFALRKAAEHKGEPLSVPLAKDVLFYNIEELRAEFNRDVEGMKIPFLWSVLVKFIIPPILMMTLMMTFTSPTFGAYESYHQWYQGWGIFLGALPWGALAINLVFPDIWDQLLPAQSTKTTAHMSPVMVGNGSPASQGKI